MVSISTPEEFLLSNESYRFKRYEPTLIKTFRDNWIKHKLSFHRKEYLIPYNCEICCLTWNNGGKFDNFSVDAFMNFILQSNATKNPDKPALIFITFQEITDLSAKGFLYQKIGFDEGIKVIEEKLINIMQRRGFRPLKLDHLFGLFGAIFASEAVYKSTSCTVEQLSLGMMGGYIANKGAIGFSVRIFESNVCFVCCHLSAHFLGLKKRNSDALSIEHKLLFKNSCPRLDDFDLVFIGGDLNFRLEPTCTDELSKSLKTRNFKWLTEHDQLIKEMKNKNIFHGYQEAPITFLPTYKFKINSSNYVYEDLVPEMKQRILYYNGKISGMMSIVEPTDAKLFSRIPSYTDRILYKCNTDDDNNGSDGDSAIACIEYNSIRAPTKSDHHPVFAKFKACLKQKEVYIYNKILGELNLTIEKWENNQIPRIKLNSSYVRIDRAIEFNMHSDILPVILTNPTYFIIEISVFPLISPELTQKWNKALKNEVMLFKHRSVSLTPLKPSKLDTRVHINSFNIFTIHKPIMESIKKDTVQPVCEKQEAFDFLLGGEDKTSNKKDIFKNDIVVPITVDYSFKARHGSTSFVCFTFDYIPSLLGSPLEYMAYRRSIDYKNVAPDVPLEIRAVCLKLNKLLRAGNGSYTPSITKLKSMIVQGNQIAKQLSKAEEMDFDFVIPTNIDMLFTLLYLMLTGLTRPVLKLNVAIQIGQLTEQMRNSMNNPNNTNTTTHNNYTNYTQANVGDDIAALERKLNFEIKAILRTRLTPLYFNTFMVIRRTLCNITGLSSECVDFIEECLVKKSTFKLTYKEAQQLREGIKKILLLE